MDRHKKKKLEQYFGKGLLVDRACKLLEPIEHAEHEISLLKDAKKTAERGLRETKTPEGKRFYDEMLTEINAAIASYKNDVWISVPWCNLLNKDPLLTSKVTHLDKEGVELKNVHKFLSERKVIDCCMINGRSEPDGTVLFAPVKGSKGKVICHGNEITVILFLWLKVKRSLPSISIDSEFCHIVKDVLCLEMNTVIDYLRAHRIPSLKDKRINLVATI